MQYKEKVSVIIPTYSRSDMLSRAIDSVLRQTYANLEVIVIDDNGENDDRIQTVKVMEKYSDNSRVKYIKHSINKGGSAARNTGIKNASGQYIALLDDDDEFLPTKLEMQLKRLNELDSSWGCVYCGCQVLIDGEVEKKYLDYSEGNLTKEVLMMDNAMFAGSTLLIKKDVLEEINGFDESFVRHQDWEMILRVFRKYKACYVNEVLANIHLDSNISRIGNGAGFEKLKEKYLSTFKKEIHQFDDETVGLIYRNHYFFVAFGYMEDKKIFKAIKWWRVSNKYHRLTKLQTTILIKGLIKFFISPKLVRKLKHKIKREAPKQ